MFNRKLILSAIAIATLFFLNPAVSENSEAQPTIERGFKKSKTEVFVDLAKRLPHIRALRREAKRMVATLPEYSGNVELPDSKTIYSWIESLCGAPNRRPGTEGDLAAEKWIADRFTEFGYEKVNVDPVEMVVWEATRWSLKVSGEDISSFYVLNTGFTGPDGVTAPLVYVGKGTPDDFKRVNVDGKIVVADVTFPEMPYGILLKVLKGAYAVSDPQGSILWSSKQYLNFVRENFIGGSTAENAPEGDVYWQAYKRGAKAICLILRDQPSNSNTHYGPYDAIMKPMPGLWIGKYDGEKLRRLAGVGAEATLTLEGATRPGTMHNIWVELPGLKDDVILVTSHHDSPFKGASEDGAGAAQVLAQAQAWAKVPIAQRPATLVFVIDGGHFYGSRGAFEFARKHQDIMKRTKILITIEHLGAKEVEERDRKYAETGRLNLTVMFTSNNPLIISTVMRTFSRTSPKVVACVPADLVGSAPTSDAAGYVTEANVPVISWIGCPYYLLDDHDTLEKIEISELNPIAQTVAELIKTYMALK